MTVTELKERFAEIQAKSEKRKTESLDEKFDRLAKKAMPFGVHKDQPFESIPLDYFLFLQEHECMGRLAGEIIFWLQAHGYLGGMPDK